MFFRTSGSIVKIFFDLINIFYYHVDDILRKFCYTSKLVRTMLNMLFGFPDVSVAISHENA